MPFRDLSLKLVIVAASLLAHHDLVVRCASVGAVPNATIQVSAPALSNPSDPEISLVHESDLLDESKLTFLAECKTDDAVTVEICKLYRSLATVLSLRKRDPATAADVNKAIAEQTDADRFCDNLSPLVQAMTQKHPDRFAKSRLETRRFCENWCVPFDDDKTMTSVHVKPICKVLLWGFQKELLSETEEQDPVKQAAKVVLSPMVPIAVGGEQAVESSHAETNPVHPVPAAQSNITVQETNVGSSPQKNIEPEHAKAPSDTAAAAVVPPAAIAEPSISHPTVVSTSTKPVITPVGQNPIEEEDDSQELRNQENLKDMNGNSPSVNNPEDIDPDDYDSGTDNDLAETAENPQPKLDNEPFDVKGPDAGDPAGDQKADSAVQVERVEQVDPFFDQDDSNFFSYFLFMMFVCILCYVAYHNKSKLLALVLEGRRTNSGRGGFNKGRKHTAAYRKLDSNLEEAITSNAAASSRSTSQIIY